MKQKTDEIKMLFNYFSRVYESLEIWAKVYKTTNPITEFRLKAKKMLAILYVGLALPNFLFLMIFACDDVAVLLAGEPLILKIFVYFAIFWVLFGIFGSFAFSFRFVLQCYTITGYKSIWLFIIGFFIPQIYCAVCSITYFFS